MEHSEAFKNYFFFIRFFPDVCSISLFFESSIYKEQIQKFVYINCNGLNGFHGKAVALDIKDYYAPFPSLFIIHEIRAREFHPFRSTPVNPDVPNSDHWQDWIPLDRVFDDVSHSFRRNSILCSKCHRNITYVLGHRHGCTCPGGAITEGL